MPTQPLDVDDGADVEAGNEIEYYETDADESVEFDKEEDDLTKKRSRFPSYDPNCVLPVFTVAMSFDNSKQFKDALIRYSVVARREIKFIKNNKKFLD